MKRAPYLHELDQGRKLTRRSRDDGDNPFFHTTGLFDQDESDDGARIDQKNGLPYDNSTETDITLLNRFQGDSVLDPMDHEGDDILPPLAEHGDDSVEDLAARWLIEHETD